MDNVLAQGVIARPHTSPRPAAPAFCAGRRGHTACPRPPQGRREGDRIFSKLTDPKNYTGAHKQRFDKQTGRGLGRQGRTDPAPAGLDLKVN